MADLRAKSPAEGLCPVTHGTCTLAEVLPGPVTSVMPFQGQSGAVSDLLHATLGVGFPGPGKVARGPDAAFVWSGKGQAFLLGCAAPEGLGALAALTDQSDAWVHLRLTGADAVDVLARLVPLDLRAPAFGEDACARTLCQHVSVSIRRCENGFDIMGFRSMAATLVHEIADAMAGVAARRSAG